MTGPEHYQKAERLLERVNRAVEQATANTVDEVVEMAAITIAAARAHAELALAAATALKGVGDPDKWLDVAG